MSGHTPGPWAIHDGGRFGEWGGAGPSVCAEHEDGTCQPLVEFAGPADAKECEANALLIAAAPDLLEVAKRAEDGLAAFGLHLDEADCSHCQIKVALRAVIAKAEGR